MAERIEAVVEFDYKAQEPDELTIKKGDFINDIRKQPGGWWEGTHVKSGKRGMFPDNFVKELDLNNTTKMDVTLRPVSGRRCRVLFSYRPANDDELELQVGDIIDILAEVEEGWWKGKLNTQVGVFPSNFVAEVFDDSLDTKEASHRKTSRSSLESDVAKPSNATTHNMSQDETPGESDVPELPPKPMKELCFVMYQYDAVNDDELTLREGDVITLLSRDGQDAGWWRGELHGKVGVFPDNFVQIITSDESTKPARPPAKSNVVTTNRVKDSITRPPTTQTTTQRKSIELPTKPDEKTSPPSLSKKPTLPPPPLKKPQRSASGPAINKALSVTQPETKGNATTPTKAPESPTNTGSAKIPLTPLTFSLRQSSVDSARAVADSTDGGASSRMSGSLTLDVDLDCVARTAMLSHPTASRVRAPRRRPPSGLPPKEAAEETGGLVNGNAEPHFSLPDDRANKAPWVEELKMNQAKKNSAQGRTRVTIGGGGGGGEPVPPLSLSPEPPKVSPSSGVTLRPTGGSAGSRPQSMFGGRSFSLSPSPSSPDTITISHRQWSELNDKVQRLEAKLESQHDAFVKAVKELTNKLANEVERRQLMQAEMEKLAAFVTQV